MNTDCQNNCAVDELCVPSNVASVIMTSWTCMKIPSLAIPPTTSTPQTSTTTTTTSTTTEKVVTSPINFCPFTYSKKCSSEANKYTKCKVAGVISVELSEQISNTDCGQNNRWGYTSSFIWVDDGCRANFQLCLSTKPATNNDGSSDSD